MLQVGGTVQTLGGERRPVGETGAGHERGRLHKVLLSLLDRLPFGVIVTDRMGAIQYTNQFAEDLLADGVGLARRQGAVVAERHADSRALLDAIGSVTAPPTSGGGRRHAISIAGRGDGEPVELLVEPAHAMAETWPELSPFRWDAGYAVLTVVSRRSEVQLRSDVLKNLYGLTGAELRLVQGLVNGCSLDEIAQAQQVSKNTVRSQLQSVFSKTDTTRQSQLIRMILTGVGVDWFT